MDRASNLKVMKKSLMYAWILNEIKFFDHLIKSHGTRIVFAKGKLFF